MRQISKEVKEMQGTFEPSREVDSVELQEWTGTNMPKAPSGWPPSIQKIWNDRCRDLNRVGYLSEIFLPELKQYCFAILQAEEAEQVLLEVGFTSQITTVKKSKEGTVTTITKPIVSEWVKVLDIANKHILAFGAKYGFTPLDIQKIPAVKKEQKSMSLLK